MKNIIEKKKVFVKIKGQSRYVSKWCMGIYDEQGNYEFKGFPTKKDAEAKARELKNSGFTEERCLISW